MTEIKSTLEAQLGHITRLRQSVLKRAFEGRLVQVSERVDRQVEKQ
jgi:hypothetical protein